MLYQCANPACGTPFRHLGKGKLFQIETDCLEATPLKKGGLRKRRYLRQVERYWLCDRCAIAFTLTVEHGGQMITVPLPGREKKAPFRVPLAHLQAQDSAAKLSTAH